MYYIVQILTAKLWRCLYLVKASSFVRFEQVPLDFIDWVKATIWTFFYIKRTFSHFKLLRPI